MHTTAVEDLSFLFDTAGFFINPEQGDIALAERIAQSRDMGEMEESQQELLLTLREEFQKSGAQPAVSGLNPGPITAAMTRNQPQGVTMKPQIRVLNSILKPVLGMDPASTSPASS